MAKKSINDISLELNLSKTTVSFVLNGKGDLYKISPKTQERILDLAKKWNFRPNQLARSLSLGQTRSIGLIIPDISNVFYANICRKIEDYIAPYHYTVTIGSSDEKPEKERELIESMRNRQMDGIIMASSRVKSDAVLQMIDEKYPLILFDRHDENVKANYVLVENEKTTMQLCKELVNKGHKRIAFITITPHASSIQERLKGYKKGLRECKIRLDSNLICEVDFNNRKEGMKKALDKLFGYASDTRAILFSNNVLAAAGIWAINMFHKEKADSLDIASFDNLDLFDYSKPKVISVAQPIEKIAQTSVELLLKKLNQTATKTERYILDPKIIFR